MNPVILIPARLGATRLPEKPLLMIGSRPMIVHVLKRAIAAGIGPVYVATDDARIEEAVREAGGQAVMTRSDHPSGSDRIFEALQLIDPKKKYDVVVNVQGDVPTIDPEVIRAVLTPLANPLVDISTLAAEIKDAGERMDPSVVKPVMTFASDAPVATAHTFTRATPPDDVLYHHIGIYAYRRAALERFVALPPSANEKREKLEQLRALDAGMRIDVAIVKTVPLGVDTQEHLEKARNLLGAR